VIDLDGDPTRVEAVVPPVSVVDEHIDKMASYVRSIFVVCFREATNNPDYGRAAMADWDGGTNRFGKKCSNIWPKIARTIVEVGADPVDYVQAQFWARQGMKAPAPNYLHSPEAIERWENYREPALAQVERQLIADENSVTRSVTSLAHGMGWDHNRALTYTLKNTQMVQATALFRYCKAWSSGLNNISAYFQAAALVQYVFRQALYDAAWGDFVPESLRQDAVDLRSRLRGY